MLLYKWVRSTDSLLKLFKRNESLFFFESVGVPGGSPELGKGNSGWVPSCPFLYGSEILIILGVVYCWEKITNMLLCVKIMLICACVMY